MVIIGKLNTKIGRQAPHSSAHSAIQGRRIWISGGAGGFGREFAARLLALGCVGLALVDIVPVSEGEVVVRSLRREGSSASGRARVIYHRVDVRDGEGVRMSMESAAREFGGLDMVVNNAGVGEGGGLREVVEVNLVAVVEATEVALGVFGRTGSGGKERVIVNVGSAGGVFPMAVAPVYSGAKFGVVGYTKSMRNACWERGVRINCLCPGWAEVGLGRKVVKRGGALTRFTGVLRRGEVAEVLVEMVRRRDLVGEAVFVSKTMGRRVVGQDLSVKLEDGAASRM